MKVKLLLLLLAVALWVSPAAGDEPAARQPAKTDKCPVCGMFVYKYPDWIAEIVYTDGEVVFFDGTKDMFKYIFDLGRYAPDRTAADMTAIYVTEFYDISLIDARSAYFVIGSDIYGPMGKELIPFETETDAAAFMKDHKGRRILRYVQITPQQIRPLD